MRRKTLLSQIESSNVTLLSRSNCRSCSILDLQNDSNPFAVGFVVGLVSFSSLEVVLLSSVVGLGAERLMMTSSSLSESLWDCFCDFGDFGGVVVVVSVDGGVGWGSAGGGRC